MNVELFRDCIARLRLVPDSKFDMSHWITQCPRQIGASTTLADPECETAGCVLGWCCVWYPELFAYELHGRYIRRTDKSGQVNFLAASDAFCIPVADAIDLFSHAYYVSDVRATIVADAMENYINLHRC